MHLHAQKQAHGGTEHGVVGRAGEAAEGNLSEEDTYVGECDPEGERTQRAGIPEFFHGPNKTSKTAGTAAEDAAELVRTAAHSIDRDINISIAQVHLGIKFYNIYSFSVAVWFLREATTWKLSSM